MYPLDLYRLTLSKIVGLKLRHIGCCDHNVAAWKMNVNSKLSKFPDFVSQEI